MSTIIMNFPELLQFIYLFASILTITTILFSVLTYVSSERGKPMLQDGGYLYGFAIVRGAICLGGRLSRGAVIRGAIVRGPIVSGGGCPGPIVRGAICSGRVVL